MYMYLTKRFISLSFQLKSEIIATYALCGFANFGSIGITLGGLGALAPSRKPELAQMVVRAMICGNVACFLTACIAGLYTAFSSFIFVEAVTRAPED